MHCVLVSGLPLGVTPNALKRCIETALNDRPVFPQNPKIIEEEALVYLPARDLASKLASKNVTVRCGMYHHIYSFTISPLNLCLMKLRWDCS